MSDKKETKTYNEPSEELEEDISDYSPCQFCPMMEYCPICYQYVNEESEERDRQKYGKKKYPKFYPGKYPHFPKKHYYHKKKYPFPFMNPYMFPFINTWNEDYEDDYEED
jgi:hypothetical protein